MPRAQVTIFHLFDVADTIQLSTIRTQIESASVAQLKTKASIPPYLQYQEPPVTIDAATVGIPETNGYRVRFKVFDYGVISIAFTRSFDVDWDALLGESVALQDDQELGADAERLCKQLVDTLEPALTRRRTNFLTEDFIVFAIPADGTTGAAQPWLAAHGPMIAQILRGEREPLSEQERGETLRHCISYYANDVTIATWSSALVYDTPDGMLGTIEILEFANSQLLQFRYYDQLLEGELGLLYNRLQTGGWSNWATRRYARAARQVQALLIDVLELTDRTENSLKIAGDVYTARLFNTTAARLGLDQWKANVREKLRALDNIYRFAIEHASIARGEFLELTIVLLIVLEIVLFAVGVG